MMSMPAEKQQQQQGAPFSSYLSDGNKSMMTRSGESETTLSECMEFQPSNRSKACHEDDDLNHVPLQRHASHARNLSERRNTLTLTNWRYADMANCNDHSHSFATTDSANERNNACTLRESAPMSHDQTPVEEKNTVMNAYHYNNNSMKPPVARQSPPQSKHLQQAFNFNNNYINMNLKASTDTVTANDNMSNNYHHAPLSINATANSQRYNDSADVENKKHARRRTYTSLRRTQSYESIFSEFSQQDDASIHQHTASEENIQQFHELMMNAKKGGRDSWGDLLLSNKSSGKGFEQTGAKGKQRSMSLRRSIAKLDDLLQQVRNYTTLLCIKDTCLAANRMYIGRAL
jgi:hypothetical protein